MTAHIIPRAPSYRAPVSRPIPAFGTHYAYQGAADLMAAEDAFTRHPHVLGSEPGLHAMCRHNALQVIGLTGGFVAEALAPVPVETFTEIAAHGGAVVA